MGHVGLPRSLRPFIVKSGMKLTLSLVKGDRQGHFDPIGKHRSLVNSIQDGDTSFVPNQP